MSAMVADIPQRRFSITLEKRREDELSSRSLKKVVQADQEPSTLPAGREFAEVGGKRFRLSDYG